MTEIQFRKDNAINLPAQVLAAYPGSEPVLRNVLKQLNHRSKSGPETFYGTGDELRQVFHFLKSKRIIHDFVPEYDEVKVFVKPEDKA